MQKYTPGIYALFFKPVIDFLIALTVLILTSPLLCLTVVLLFVANRGKVWFLQPRPGKHGKIFKVIKFKTMTDERDEKGNLLSDEKRLTMVGAFVRKTSIDELPQLINVLKGDMSIIGPRPLLTEYLSLYNETQKQRHWVKPGITGYAQVNGRNTISWEEKFRYDVWYVHHLSLWIDISILVKTVAKVFKSEGISSGNSVTMEKFGGNK